MPDEKQEPLFFPFGPFGDAFILSRDQLHRAQVFLDRYFVWGLLTLLVWQYFVGFHWTASFILLYGAFYFLRMQLLLRTCKTVEHSTNLEEVSIKLVKLQTIGSLLAANLFCFGFLLWGIYQVTLAWPIPVSLLVSDIFTLIFFFLLFTYSTILLYLKGQALQKP